MRNIPENNLAYPVLLTSNKGGSGSGFMLFADNKQYLVTAKHVLCNTKGQVKFTDLSIIRHGSDVKDTTFGVSQLKLKECRVMISPKYDVCAIEMGVAEPSDGGKSFKIMASAGVTIKSVSKSQGIMVRETSCKGLDDVLISNDIFLYGYPSSLGMRKSPQFDYNVPLIRRGIVAGVNRKMRTIILDCPVYYGNSGGPVVQLTRLGDRVEHAVIGVVSQFIPFVEEWRNMRSKQVNTEVSNSGYSVAVSIETVLELIGKGASTD